MMDGHVRQVTQELDVSEMDAGRRWCAQEEVLIMVVVFFL